MPQAICPKMPENAAVRGEKTGRNRKFTSKNPNATANWWKLRAENGKMGASQRKKEERKTMSFGENLQYCRSEIGLTQEQLAERLEVSRQSVSKWESDASFPEMEKLLTLCDLFRCDLDTLLRGDVKASRQADTAGYDEHMDRFTKTVTTGVVLCICGLSATMAAEGLTGTDRWSGPAFLLFVLVAVVLFVIGGIRHGYFCEQHERIEPFYDPKTLAAWRQRFPVFAAGGVGLILAAMIVMLMLDDLRLFGLTASRSESLIDSFGLLLIAAGVGLLVYGGMQDSKYKVESYNKERAEERSPHYKRLGQIQGAIMLVSTAVFLLYLYFWKTDIIADGHGLGFGAAVIFGVGGLLCAVVSTLFRRE